MRRSCVRRWRRVCCHGDRYRRCPGRGSGVRGCHGCKTSRRRGVLRRAMRIAPSSNQTPAGRYEALPLPAPYDEPSHGGRRANDPPRCAHHGGWMVTAPALAPELFGSGTRSCNGSGTRGTWGGMSGTKREKKADSRKQWTAYEAVIPAKAGTHVTQPNMGPRFRGDDYDPTSRSLLSAVCSLPSPTALTPSIAMHRPGWR